jgi:opacity protein-like surface antigen
VRKFYVVALLCVHGITTAAASDFYQGVKVDVVKYGYSNVSRNNQIGLGYLLGYSFNKKLAVEIEYHHLGGMETSTSLYKGYATAINAVAAIPLNPQFSIFGKLGVASTVLKDYPRSGALNNPIYYNTGLAGGLGGQYNVTEGVGIRTEYYGYQVGDSRNGTTIASMYSVGGVFKF